MLAGLAYVLLPAADLDRSVTFYRDALDLAQLWHEREQGHAAFQVSEALLILSSRERPSSGHGAVIAFDVEDLDEACRLLEQRGIAFPSGIEEHAGRRTARFADPDGNLLELNQLRRHPTVVGSDA